MNVLSMPLESQQSPAINWEWGAWYSASCDNIGCQTNVAKPSQ